MSTTIPTVTAKLLELFRAAVEEPTEVWPARPTEDHQMAENVYLGDIRGSRTFHSMPATSPKARQEDYEVTVEVEVERQGTELEATEARMWVIVEALEAVIAAKPHLEGFWDSAICTRFDQQTLTNETAVLAKYTFGVEVTARV